MDHYAVLGVAKNATPDEIKKAYRKLASQHHPDKGGDTAKFQQIQEAYAILSDPGKRQQYDNPQPQGFGFHPGPGGFQWNVDGMDIHDIFSQMFGQAHPGQRNNRQIYRTRINVSLLDAFNGSTQTLKIQNEQESKVVELNIPKGVMHGTQIRYDNLLPNSSLLVQFHVLPDLKFERRQDDLLTNHAISVLDLIVGTEFNFQTISGKNLLVKIKPKTQPYMQIRLPGQGMPIMNSGNYGDQLILLKPYIPDNISDDIIDSILRNRGN
jgi:curved DNA-binding protein